MDRAAISHLAESSSSDRHAFQTSGTAAAVLTATFLLPFNFAELPPTKNSQVVINRVTQGGWGQSGYAENGLHRYDDDSLQALTRSYWHSRYRHRLDSLVGKHGQAFTSAFLALDLLKACDSPRPLINFTGESILFEFVINETRLSVDFYDTGEIVYLRQAPTKNTWVEEAAADDLTRIISQISEEYVQTDV